MSEPFLGEIKIISWNFPPKGWTFCNGQLLPINQNQALFSILGTTYGGDGMRTFGLPNLQGRSPVHVGNGIVLGEMGGETAHTLNISELPAHNHVPVGTSNQATLTAATGNLWASDSSNPFTPSPSTSMNPACIVPAGGNQPHENMSPYLVLNFIIALQGIFPSQN
ncbi:MAG TPA: tail fiber protein [Candidatus Acidoferrales bacterium]|nr:tail fiber protein [Candidatus Acidoferrales bacterium]